jgi:Cu(I)/Ag(I) efflux system membrane protein CusA/SilA
MLATGIRTPVGIKIFGPDLNELERLAKEIEVAVQMVPGTRSAFGERVVSGSYLDIDIDRDAAARYGLSVEQIQMVIQSAVGGMNVTRTVEGRERYGVRVRYPQELRDQPDKIEEILIPVGSRRGGYGMEGMAAPATMSGDDESGRAGAGSAGEAGATGMAMAGGGAVAGGSGAQIPLGQLATIRTVGGPMMVKTEQAFPTAWVFVDVRDSDLGSYVAEAKDMVASMVELPAGYSLTWSGQYEYMQRAKARLTLVVPATLLIIFLLLYLNFRTVSDTLIVMLSLPFSLVGGVLLMALLGYHWSVATAIGFVALAGVAAETGVIMLIYLRHAWHDRVRDGHGTLAGLHDAIMEGAVMRVRPKMMTVIAIMAGLLPLFWGHGAGGTVMRRIAAPMVGGMVSATVLTLIVIPAIYSLWQEALVRRAARQPAVEADLQPVGAD